jgi:superfamily II DNA or RNA helicase
MLTITEPTSPVINWIIDNLTIANPDYTKKSRMGLWTGNTPKVLTFYIALSDGFRVPFGCLRELLPIMDGADLKTEFKKVKKLDFGGSVPLYDYQEEAVAAMLIARYGILQSPAGSGKTQMGIALAQRLGLKTLWLTHTLDLLKQSKSRAEMYLDPSGFGVISEGEIQIGKTMTFATVQTLAKADLESLKDEWDVIIVDECHRVAGTPNAATMFSKVLNNLRARHKFGLSATVHRADGLIKATYAMLGTVQYTVPDEAVAGRVMKVTVVPRGTGIGMSREFLDTDGTIVYSKMITYLGQNQDRNEIILQDLIENCDHSNLILSDRLEHLVSLMSMLPDDLMKYAVFINGKMTSKKGKLEREYALEDMRSGKKRYLFATYSLAKEGLDIPRLDRLYLATPQKDYAVITQSIGRVARTCEGKEDPIAYDYVDPMTNTVKAFKKRCTTYRKLGCEIGE